MSEYQTKAEAYVRSQIPELSELSFGCEVALPRSPSVTYLWEKNKDEVYVRLGKTSRRNKTIPFGRENLTIIGHPIQPHHYLVAMDLNSTDKRTLIKVSANMMRVEVRGIVVMFNLTTGQPATEEDYKAFNEIVGV